MRSYWSVPLGAIFRLMIVLVLLIAVAGGGGAYWFYSLSNELLRAEALRQLRDMAPDLKFGIERAAYDLSGRVCLYGLSVQLPEDVEPSLYIPETLVTLEQQPMTDFKDVTVQRVRIVKPLLRVTRQSNGRWNWQGIMVRGVGGSQPLPDVEIERGTAVVELHRDGRATRKLKLNDLNLTTHPTSARQVAVVVSTRIDPAGPLNATAEINLDGFPLTIDATWKSFPINDGLLQLLGDVSPAVEEQLQQARRSMVEIAARQVAAVSITPPAANTREAANRSQTPNRESRIQSPPVLAPVEFGLSCVCDLDAKFHLAEAGVPPRFQVMATLKSGQLSNALLPFPLYELGGVLYVDDREAVVRGLRAENGAVRLSVDANAVAGRTPQVELHAQGIEIDEPLKARLPESARKLLNSLALKGMCDVDVKSRADQAKLNWDVDLRLSKATLAHEKFPYLVRDVTGTATLRDNVAHIEGRGTAGGVPLTMTGIVKNPGPNQDADFFIQVDGIPIDAELLAASPPVVRNVFSAMKLQGQGDVRFRARRPAGPDQRFNLNLAVKLRDSSSSFTGFPYAVNRLSGLVFWDGDIVRFEELQGEHDGAKLTAAGRFQRLPAPGRLDLSIQTRNAAFDRGLEGAVPDSLRQVWREFQPKGGHFDCDTEISWVPGQPCEVTLPSIQVKDADIQLACFPWPLQNLKCELTYSAPKLEVKSFSARHDETHIHGRGMATVPPLGERWHMRFDELFIDDLIPNATFRKALPNQLRSVSETLNPTGKFSTSGPVDLYGPQRLSDNISAAWNLKVVLAGCAANAGVRIEDIHGRIDVQGEFDGQQTELSGQLDLDSISVFRQPSGVAHQVTRVVGPIQLHEGQFTAGSRAVVYPAKGATSPPSRVPLSERIIGEAIDGKITLDAVVDLRSEIDYRASLTLAKGRLERYAQKYLHGQSDVAGIMNGWLNFSGKGTSADQVQGRGKLLIAPAALYELPLFVQMFRTLRLDASDRIAFDTAEVEFNIGNSRFNFENIYLVGQAISFRGGGYIRFDGEMQLDFLSKMGRSQVQIPLLNEIANRLSRGWVGVKVTGNVGLPRTQMIPVPEFDDAMKQLFLGPFDGTVTQPSPRSRPSEIRTPPVRRSAAEQ